MTCTATRHGTATAYKNWGCRCDDARTAARRQRKTRHLHAAYVDATGSRRRLQALVAMGWEIQYLAGRLGYHSQMGPLLYVADKRVTRRTAEKVAALYDELCMAPGGSRRALAAARRHRWAPPLAWDDDKIDDPRAYPNRTGSGVTGDVARLDRQRDRWDVVAEMTRVGYPAEVIAGRLGISTRQVERVRAKQRKEAA